MAKQQQRVEPVTTIGFTMSRVEAPQSLWSSLEIFAQFFPHREHLKTRDPESGSPRLQMTSNSRGGED